MAQVYTFTDANGEIRLMAEINPAPGGGLPAEWTIGANGSLTIAPSAPGNTILEIDAPIGSAGSAIVVRDENGNLTFEVQAESGSDIYSQNANIAALDIHSVADANDGKPILRVRSDLDGTHPTIFSVASNGHMTSTSQDDFAVAVDAIGSLSQVVAILQAQTAGGDKLFKVMPDGSLHGKTGQSLVFDL